MKKVKKLVISVLLFVLAVIATACSQATSANNTNTGTSVTKVRVAHTQTYVPYDYVNEKGESDGFEVQVLKAVDELLPQYEFSFFPTSDDDLLIGVESGKYDIGVKGAWFTEERAKKYVFPKSNIAASIIGITFRTENSKEITDMESFARFSGKLVPIAPQNAQWAIVEEYNKTHPDNQVKLVASEAFNVSDAYTWVLEGRYDAYFDIKLSFGNNVTSETGAYHEFVDSFPMFPIRESRHNLFSIKGTGACGCL